jgi:WD40 repeat protein
MGNARLPGELCLAKVTPFIDNSRYETLLVTQNKEIWTSAVANDNSGVISVGISGGGHIFDLSTNKIICNIDSHRSDIMSQKFDPTNSNLLWNGKRDGVVSLLDARLGSEKKAPSLIFFAGSIASPVNCILPLDRTGLMITTNMKGEIRCWDTRFLQPVKNKRVQRVQPVVTYDGHSNGLQRNINVSVDPVNGQHLFAGGDDGLLRVWDLKTGGTSLMQVNTKKQVTDIVWNDYGNNRGTLENWTCLLGCSGPRSSNLYVMNL